MIVFGFKEPVLNRVIMGCETVLVMGMVVVGGDGWGDIGDGGGFGRRADAGDRELLGLGKVDVGISKWGLDICGGWDGIGVVCCMV